MTPRFWDFEALSPLLMLPRGSQALPGRSSRGTQKKSDGPWRGWLVPREPKKYQGWSDFFEFFLVLLNSHRQETPKNAIKQKKLRKN
jgi:hypothetical protein